MSHRRIGLPHKILDDIRVVEKDGYWWCAECHHRISRIPVDHGDGPTEVIKRMR